MAADSSDGNNHHHSYSSGSNANSPQSRQRGLQSPWSKVVTRGGEPESSSPAAGSPSSPMAIASPDAVVPALAPPPEPENAGPEIFPDGSDDSNGNAARLKKPAWNKPLNGVAEGTSVMGGSVSWPALSESTRSGAKLPSDSLKPPSDGPASSYQGPIISQAPQKQANNSSNSNAHTNSAANHGVTRQKSMKHRGSGSGQGGFNRPPPPPPPMPPPFPAFIEMPPYGNYGNFVPPVLDSSARGSRPLSGVGSQAGNDHSTHSQRNTSRRNNYSGRPRGDGQYHNNHGGRRDHDRRDIHLSHQFVAPPPPPPPPGGFMPPPPPPPHGSAAFIGPPPMRPFMGPLGFDMSSPYVYVPTLSTFIPPTPPAPMFFTVDPLPALIIKQIDYYFSDANLVKDDFLRSNMDEEGWVPINLIASFPRVQQLTADISFILDSLRGSMVVEVKGDKIRRRNDWKRWIHTGSHHSPDSGSLTPGRTSHDILATSINKISISEVTSSNRDVLDSKHLEQELAQDRHVPEKSAGSSTVANGDVSAGEFHES